MLPPTTATTGCSTAAMPVCASSSWTPSTTGPWSIKWTASALSTQRPWYKVCFLSLQSYKQLSALSICYLHRWLGLLQEVQHDWTAQELGGMIQTSILGPNLCSRGMLHGQIESLGCGKPVSTMIQHACKSLACW